MPEVRQTSGKVAWEWAKVTYWGRIGSLLPEKWANLPEKGVKKAGESPKQKICYTYGAKKKIRSPKPKGFRLRIPKSRLTGLNGFLLPKTERYNKRSQTCLVWGWMNNILNPKSYCIDILVIANMISRAWISSELGCIAFFAGSTTKAFAWRLAWKLVQCRILVSFKWYWHVAEAIFGKPEPIP